MNVQEYYDLLVCSAFDGTFPSLLSEEEKRRLAAENEDLVTNCAYRGEHGRKCGFGIALPDEQYDHGMEGMCVQAVIQDFLNGRGPVDGFSLSSYGKVQTVHDEQAMRRPWNPGNFIRRINNLVCFSGCNQLTGKLEDTHEEVRH